MQTRLPNIGHACKLESRLRQHFPEGKRPFLGGSPEQIAQDLTRVQNLKVDEVFFSDQASPTVDEAVQRLEEIQTAVRR